MGLEVSHINLEHNRSIHDVYNLSFQTHNMTSQLFVQVVVLATINVPADKAIVTFFMGRPDYSVCFLPYTEIDLAKPPYPMKTEGILIIITTLTTRHRVTYMYTCT